jgi:CxxC-x17-CxxC domain-containing protein
MPFDDKTIVCADCGQEFTHSVADQERYAQRGLTNDPKRCKPCREKRRAQQGAKPGGGGGGGGGGRSGNRFGGGGGGAGGGGGPDRRGGQAAGRRRFFAASEPRRKTEFHDAVCAECGKQTTVPFKPVEGRPVLCRDCYQKSRGGGSPRPTSGGDEFGEGL